MKKQILAALALVALGCGAASAADLYTKAPRAVAVAPACAQFGGGYIGVHGGSVLHDWQWNDNDAWARNEFDANLPDSARSNRFGFEVGPRIGWDWQSGCTLWGFVADWSWSGLRSTRSLTDGDTGAAQDFLTVQRRLDWYGTVRTRGGVIVNNVLIYATGGFAYASIRTTATAIDTGVATETFSDRTWRWGGVVGVGTEWAWTGNWSIGTEFLYVRFADRDSSFNSAVAVANGNNPAKSFTNQDSLLISRFSLNYRWGAPVVARY